MRLERDMTMEIRGAHTLCTLSGGRDVQSIIYQITHDSAIQYPGRDF